MTVSFQTISGRKINVALVGCGRISLNHIKAIVFHYDQVELVALCDTEQDCLDNARKLVLDLTQDNSLDVQEPRQFLDYNELLKEVHSGLLEVDLVVLTTPSGLHSTQTIAAAEVGLHVCTEKPMATCWSDGLEMVRACDKAGVALFVVKQNRFNETLQLVKRQLQSGRFGQLALIAVNVFWQRPQSYYDQASWRGTRALDGGALMNQASHYIDLLDWLIGPVERLSASIGTLARNIESEDTAVMQLKWKNGALGTMAVTMLAYPRNIEGSITILGETGTAKIGGTAVNKIELWDFADRSSDDLLVESASYETKSVYGFGHFAYYTNLIETLRGDAIPMCDGKSGLKSLELLAAAYKSAYENTSINLPLDFA